MFSSFVFSVWVRPPRGGATGGATPNTCGTQVGAPFFGQLILAFSRWGKQVTPLPGSSAPAASRGSSAPRRRRPAGNENFNLKNIVFFSARGPAVGAAPLSVAPSVLAVAEKIGQDPIFGKRQKRHLHWVSTGELAWYCSAPCITCLDLIVDWL